MPNALALRWRQIRQIAQDPVLFGTLLVVVAALLLFIVYPLFSVLVHSVVKDGRLDLSFYQRYLFRSDYRQIFINTMILGTGAALLSTAVGFLFAYTMVRCSVPLRGLYNAIALLPIISPPFAVGMALILLFGRRGFITYTLLHLDFKIYGLHGLLAVQTLTFFPVAYLMFIGLLEALPPSLEEQALNLGASKGHIFRTVTLPLLIPGFAASFLLIFVESLADLANPLLLSGDFSVLADQIFRTFLGQFDVQSGAGLCVILLLPSLTAFVIQRYWVSQRSYIAVTGKPTGGHIQITEPYIRYPLIAAITFISAFVVLIYATILIGALTRLWGIDYTPSPNNFMFALFGARNPATVAQVQNQLAAALAPGLALLILAVGGMVALRRLRFLPGWIKVVVYIAGLMAVVSLPPFDAVRQITPNEALTDTTLLAAVATPIAAFYGIIIAFLVVRKEFIGKEIMDFTAMLGAAVPGTMLGVGYVLAFNKPPIAITGTWLIIVMIFAVRSIPTALRAGVASLQQIDPSIEEAATNLGADSQHVFRTITLPLIQPALLAGMIYSFTRHMTSLSAVIFVVSPGWKIMTQQILDEVEAARLGNAAAYSVVLIVIVLIAIAILYRLTGQAREAGEMVAF